VREEGDVESEGAGLSGVKEGGRGRSESWLLLVSE
jgi:hypothetical protein